MVNMAQISKLGNAIVNIGASLYMFKKMGFFDKYLENKNKATDYYEVVEVIVSTDMLERYKMELINVVENNKTPSYYKAVTEIVKSDMLTANKVEMIRNMSLK